jgi:dTDP-L-rhamnose 4-epimerase
MSKHILITGGAGFIGSHLADELLENGYRVRVLDNLSDQVHGPNAKRPAHLSKDVEFMKGDVRNEYSVRHALKDVDGVFHLAALVGVGQSMYQVTDYTHVNTTGTSVLLEALIERPVERLVVASDMSLYGEGLYRRMDGSCVAPVERSLEQLKVQDWELHDRDGSPLTPIPTPETKRPSLTSVYALSKFDQEQLCLMLGRAYKIPTVALRFFNVYGTRQALSNPYTGVLAIFASRLLNDKPPFVFEDGLQLRDFVSVYDAAHACRLALDTTATGQVFNIGSGEQFTILEVARRMAVALDKTDQQPEITGKYRTGDIRHCVADITLARDVLGYQPVVTFDEGLEELTAWLEGKVAVDHLENAKAELSSRGLTV